MEYIREPQTYTYIYPTSIAPLNQTYINGQQIMWEELAYLLDRAKEQMYTDSDHDTLWKEIADKYLKIFDSIGDEDGK